MKKCSIVIAWMCVSLSVTAMCEEISSEDFNIKEFINRSSKISIGFSVSKVEKHKGVFGENAYFGELGIAEALNLQRSGMDDEEIKLIADSIVDVRIEKSSEMIIGPGSPLSVLIESTLSVGAEINFQIKYTYEDDRWKVYDMSNDKYIGTINSKTFTKAIKSLIVRRSNWLTAYYESTYYPMIGNDLSRTMRSSTLFSKESGN